MKPRKFTRDDIPNKFRDRFWSRVDRRGPDDCWEWTEKSPKPGEYGRFLIYADGKSTAYLAHRFAYTMAYGYVPDDLLVCHSCDNRRCCNPRHLWVGTDQDNAQDMWSKGRGQRGENHSYAKLTANQVLEMRSILQAGATQSKVADMYGVNRATVGDIYRRSTWKHI